MAVLDRKNNAVLSESAGRRVRHAEEQDLDQLLLMYREVRTAGLPGVTWSESYPDDEDIRNDVAHRALYVMESQGELIASLAVEEDEVKELVPCDPHAVSGEISRVAVRLSMQGRGLSGELLTETLNLLKEEGYQVIRLLVSRGNLPAFRAYQKAGFEIIGEADKYDVHWTCCEKWL